MQNSNCSTATRPSSGQPWPQAKHHNPSAITQYCTIAIPTPTGWVPHQPIACFCESHNNNPFLPTKTNIRPPSSHPSVQTSCTSCRLLTFLSLIRVKADRLSRNLGASGHCTAGQRQENGPRVALAPTAECADGPRPKLLPLLASAPSREVTEHRGIRNTFTTAV